MTHPLILALCVILATATAQSASPQDKAAEKARKSKRDFLVALQAEDGLHKVAKENGGTYKLITPFRPYVQQNSLGDVLQETIVVVRGSVLKNASRLNPHGNTIRTDYEFAIESVVYGKVEKGQITVSLPGGMVRYEDGSVVEHMVPEYRRMVNGSAMILFLRRDEAGRFAPATGPTSLFEVAEGKVYPYAPRGSSLAPTYYAMPEQAFVAEIGKAMEGSSKSPN